MERNDKEMELNKMETNSKMEPRANSLKLSIR